MTIQILDALERRLRDPGLLDYVGALGTSLVQKNIITGPWAPNSALTQRVKGGNLPLRDSAKPGLVNSMTHTVRNDTAVIGTNHPAAVILHNGGTITPKTSRYLAIPLGAETRRFMHTYGATPRKCLDAMAADGYKVWVAKGCILVQKGKTGRVRALFVLKKSAKIPARQFMRLPEASVRIIETAVRRRGFG